MKKYSKGDKSRAICENCGLVHTTFFYRNVTIEKHAIRILAGVCDRCDTVVAIPAQATATIKRALARAAAASNLTPAQPST